MYHARYDFKTGERVICTVFPLKEIVGMVVRVTDGDSFISVKGEDGFVYEVNRTVTVRVSDLKYKDIENLPKDNIRVKEFTRFQQGIDDCYERVESTGEEFDGEDLDHDYEKIAGDRR